MSTKGTSAYPLAWPISQPRTKTRSNSRFRDKTIATSIKSLKLELQRLQAQYVVISTNVPLKVNGDPYSDPGKLPDPGVAVYFQLKGKPYCLPCDRWLTVEENLYAIAKHIEMLRGIDRYGVGSVEQTFAGFKQLASESEVEEKWWLVLGVLETATVEQINAAHRIHVKKLHPDRCGGDHKPLGRVNAARDRALAERAGDK